ncbi:hypothetical protein Sviol_48550 [Streptomyces violascens]|uniref:Uncharacterized protein n=1 Tax=Streptomyces violascens TaxID=67381 RepID=A0ABQ3QT36_9ACTN|nr:hypothetical protein Sviol_48550 [Streptomyces violascens]
MRGLYGRLKNSTLQRHDMVMDATITNEETVVVPRKEIQIAGANAVFSCETASSQSYGTKTVCAWADENTAGCVEFKPHSSPIRRPRKSAEYVTTCASRSAAEQGRSARSPLRGPRPARQYGEVIPLGMGQGEGIGGRAQRERQDEPSPWSPNRARRGRGGPARRVRRPRRRHVQRSAVHDVLRSGGRPLDDATRTDMENTFTALLTAVSTVRTAIASSRSTTTG